MLLYVLPAVAKRAVTALWEPALYGSVVTGKCNASTGDTVRQGIYIRRDVKQRSRDGNAAPGQLERAIQRAVSEVYQGHIFWA